MYLSNSISPPSSSSLDPNDDRTLDLRPTNITDISSLGRTFNYQSILHPTRISVGYNHYGIIDKNGNLWMGGDNSFAQRGIDSSINEKELNKLSFLSSVTYVDCNGHSTAAITEDGTIYVFGAIIHHVYKRRSTIIKIEDIFAKFISVSDLLFGAISHDGSVYIQLRDDAFKISEIKAKYLFIPKTSLLMADINIGVIAENGELLIYQINLNTEHLTIKHIDMPEPISIIKMDGESVERMSYLALSESGNVYAWGHNNYGQLGLGHSHDISIPTKINLPKIKSIDIKNGIVGAVTEDGKLFMWGNNDLKLIQAGDDGPPIPIPYIGSREIRIPIEISLGNEEKISNMSIGLSSVMALTKTEKIKMWYSGASNSIYRYHDIVKLL